MRGVFPASFDPMTNGHVDLASRASRLCDELVVAVYDRPAKVLLFSLDERLEMAAAALSHLPNVRVKPFTGLLVSFARQIDANFIIRGMRGASDFDVELRLAAANRQMAPEIETIALFGDSRWEFVSSTLIKEIALLGGDITAFVPALVAQRLRDRASS
jgi:pantetheine-phosphate adenylyltransferase